MSRLVADPRALLAFVEARIEHDLGEIDHVHLLDCRRDSAGCDCLWPDQLRAGIDAKQIVLKEFREHLAAPPTDDRSLAKGWLDALEATVCVLAGEWAMFPGYDKRWAL